MEENIIIRAEKIREIGEALKAKNILYISAFYGSGKTVLLDQTAARGMIEDAIEITDNIIERLPRDAPRRLRDNHTPRYA